MFPRRTDGAFFKPEPIDAAAMKEAAKARDDWRCRRPHCPHCGNARGLPVDGAHAFQAKGMGGDPRGARSERRHFLTLCRRSHQEQERHQLVVRARSVRLLGDGRVSFYTLTGSVSIYEGTTQP